METIQVGKVFINYCYLFKLVRLYLKFLFIYFNIDLGNA